MLLGNTGFPKGHCGSGCGLLGNGDFPQGPSRSGLSLFRCSPSPVDRLRYCRVAAACLGATVVALAVTVADRASRLIRADGEATAQRSMGGMAGWRVGVVGGEGGEGGKK